MDRMCLWFCRRLVSPVAVTLLIRHFIIESNMLAFIARNAAAPPGRPPPEPSLRPRTIGGLGNRAVIERDLNVYRVLRALGQAAAPPQQRDTADLDYSMLTIPNIDPEHGSRRLVDLDIQTALCLMNIPFALCLTPAEYRRAVHSMRLDTSLLSVLTAITGDATFLGWASGLPVRVDSNADVPRMVYEHALLCEYAHARLVEGGTVVSVRAGSARKCRSAAAAAISRSAPSCSVQAVDEDARPRASFGAATG